MSFYEKVNNLCRKNGVAISALAENIGLSRAAPSRWKAEKAAPKNSTIKAIADYFGVPISYFYGDSDEEPMNISPAESEIVQIEGFKLYNIPVYEDIAAGFGAQANDFVVDYTPLPFKSESEANESLVFHVIGDSMQPKIENGDYVQVRKQTSVDSGDIAAVLLDEEKGLLKKVVYGADYISLISLNPSYEPMVFAGKDVLRVRVLGKVKKIIREP